MSHWHRYARHWGQVASPLSPHADDLRVYAQELDARAPTLLLGVTPQIAALDLRGVAVDHNLDMIRACPPPTQRWQVLQADWLALPLPERAVTQVVGDGVLSVLRYPDDYAPLLQGLCRVLRDDGKCVLRLFVPPAQTESLADIQRDLTHGRIGSFHALKWRLMMSLCHSQAAYQVSVADVLALFDSAFADRSALLRLTGWPQAVFETIDVYRNSSVSLSFVPHAKLDALFTRFARRVRYCTGSYELAERCPIVILEGLYQR
jgi:SAM-dependent methyltransferase